LIRIRNINEHIVDPKLLEKIIITGREGFFCIKSSEDLTLQQALQTYRKKDSIEKIFNSMKNEIEIKPVHKFNSANEFKDWYNDRIHGYLELEWDEIPNDSFVIKMKPESILGRYLNVFGR